MLLLPTQVGVLHSIVMNSHTGDLEEFKEEKRISIILCKDHTALHLHHQFMYVYMY